MSHFNSEPLTNVDILNDELPCLVNNLVIENILPHLKQFLSFDEQETISSARTQSAKTLATIESLTRRTSCKSYKAFNAFFKILGGTQPQLFTSLVGRPPTEAEANFCIEGISIDLKNDIPEKGHIIDSALDQQIDLDSQHVQLHIIKSEPGKVDFARTDAEVLYVCSYDKQLPHEYQHHLSEVEERDGSIPVSDVLNAKDQQAERVLVSGRAGVGKTTTLQWLARQWALNKWATGFMVLFLMQLRMLSHIDVSITAIDLITLYGLFQVTKDDNQKLLHSWLKNSAKGAIILVDGLDEILGFAEKLKNTPKITDLKQKAHPIALCINILRGNLLPECTVICTSRPFVGLSKLGTDMVFEIIGLSRSQVKNYIKRKRPDKAEEIVSVLDRNPILMSVCGITFYCMVVCTLLAQGVEVLDEDFQSYTRLTAFILIQYMSRTFSDWPFVIQVRPYFSKLAHLAHIGIFQAAEDQKLSKLVFDEYDLSDVGLTPSDIESIKKGGILQIKEMKNGRTNSIVAEFLHSSIQEMLAIGHLLSNPLPSFKEFMNVFSGGQFNMALIYFFGFQDIKSDWVKDVYKAVKPPSLKPNSTSDVKLLMSSILHELCYEPRGNQNTTLKICQLVHESQDKDFAKSVVDYIVINGVLRMKKITMTAIDIMAIAFVCQQAQCLENITLSDVNGDCAFLKVISYLLIKVHSKTIKLLDLSRNKIDYLGVQALAEVLTTHQTLNKLYLSFNNIGNRGAKALAQALCMNTTLSLLAIRNTKISDDGAKALGEALKYNKGLQVLDLHGNQVGGDGAEHLATGLQCNSALTTLNVSSNWINMNGAVSFSKLIHHTKSLQSLNLAGNNLFNEGAIALAKGLVSNNSMHTINVWHCKVGTAGQNALAEVQKLKPTLMLLM